jgi:EF hand domain-containing protein
MPFSSKIVPPIILTIAVLMATPVFAQTARDPAPPRDWAQYYLTRVDLDNKGYFTLEDAKRYASAQFDRLDTDHDGLVDHDEFVAALKNSIERSNSPDRKARLERELARRETLFHTLDQKGDGKITKDEYLAATVQHFSELDADKTGKITPQELRAAHHGL